MVLQLSAVALLATNLLASLNAQSIDEYPVKAAFLYNFAKFVEWPVEAFRDADEPFTICVLGKDPFGRALDDVIAGRTIGVRPLALRRISDARQTAGCRVLYISSSEPKHVLATIAAAKQPYLLTVGEAGGLPSQRAIIAFTSEQGKVRFYIDRAEAAEGKLSLSSKLLSLALPVTK